MKLDIESIKQTLDRDGVCAIPSVFSYEEICELRRAIFETLITIDEDRKYHEGGAIQWRSVEHRRWPAIMFWPALISPPLRSVREDARFVSLIRDLIGPDVRQMNNQVYFRLPNDGDEFNIHQDAIFRSEVDDWNVILKSYYQTIIAIDPIDSQSGGISFFIGSHKGGSINNITENRSNLRRMDEALYEEMAEIYPCKIFDLNPGDMLIWTLGVAHGSRKNSSNTTRFTYMNGFCSRNSSQSWPEFLVAGEVVGLTNELIPSR